MHRRVTLTSTKRDHTSQSITGTEGTCSQSSGLSPTTGLTVYAGSCTVAASVGKVLILMGHHRYPHERPLACQNCHSAPRKCFPLARTTQSCITPFCCVPVVVNPRRTHQYG